MTLGVYNFLSKKIMEKSELLHPLVKKYPEVWEKLLNYRDDNKLVDLDDGCVYEVFKGKLAKEWVFRGDRKESKNVEEKRIPVKEDIPLLETTNSVEKNETITEDNSL